MDYNYAFDISDGDYIAGIYNYCDRWCERCIYTAKCRVYASEEIADQKNKADKYIKASMKENMAFWEQINKIIEETAELIDEEIPLKKFDNYSDEVEFDKDDEDALLEHDRTRNKAKKQELSIVSSRYEKAASDWFKKREGILSITYHTEKYGLRLNYHRIQSAAVLEKLSNAVEIIQWYSIQIWVKTQRALTSYFEETENSYLFEEQPIKDSDGSMFVALTGINRSIAAWSYLHQTLEAERESIKPLIRLLFWLKPEIEKKFPKARNFIWPPK